MRIKSKEQFLAELHALQEKRKHYDERSDYFYKLSDRMSDRHRHTGYRIDEKIERYVRSHAHFPVGSRFKLKNGVGLEVVRSSGDFDKGKVFVGYELGYTKPSSYRQEEDDWVEVVRMTETALKQTVRSGEYRPYQKGDWWVPYESKIKEIKPLDAKPTKVKNRWGDVESMYKDCTYILTLENDIFAKITLTSPRDIRAFEPERLKLIRNNGDPCNFYLAYKAPRKRLYQPIRMESFVVDVFFKTKEEAVLAIM